MMPKYKYTNEEDNERKFCTVNCEWTHSEWGNMFRKRKMPELNKYKYGECQCYTTIIACVSCLSRVSDEAGQEWHSETTHSTQPILRCKNDVKCIEWHILALKLNTRKKMSHTIFINEINLLSLSSSKFCTTFCMHAIYVSFIAWSHVACW